MLAPFHLVWLMPCWVCGWSVHTLKLWFISDCWFTTKLPVICPGLKLSLKPEYFFYFMWFSFWWTCILVRKLGNHFNKQMHWDTCRKFLGVCCLGFSVSWTFNWTWCQCMTETLGKDIQQHPTHWSQRRSKIYKRPWCAYLSVWLP